MAPAIEALSPDEDSEETLVVSKKKLEELVRRLERHLEELTKENERLRQMLELQEGRRSPQPSTTTSRAPTVKGRSPTSCDSGTTGTK